MSRTRRRHAEFYLEHLEAFPDDWEWFDQQWDQIRRAWQGLDEEEAAAFLERYAARMIEFLEQRGWWLEALAWTEKVLDFPLPLQTRVSWLVARGTAHERLSQLGQAQAALQEALVFVGAWQEARAEVEAQHGLPQGTLPDLGFQAWVLLMSLGRVLGRAGEVEQSRAYLQEAVGLARRSGNQEQLLQALNQVAWWAVRQGEQETGWYEALLEEAEVAGALLYQAEAWCGLGKLHQARGEIALACVAYEHALPLLAEAGLYEEQMEALVALVEGQQALGQEAQAAHHRQQARGLAWEGGWMVAVTFAELCQRENLWQEAQRMLAYALALAQQEGHRWGEAGIWGKTGNFFLAMGQPAQARRCYEEALTLFRQMGEVLLEVEALRGLGASCRGLGDEATARRYEVAAQALLDEKELSGPPLWEVHRAE